MKSLCQVPVKSSLAVEKPASPRDLNPELIYRGADHNDFFKI